MTKWKIWVCSPISRFVVNAHTIPERTSREHEKRFNGNKKQKNEQGSIAGSVEYGILKNSLKMDNANLNRQTASRWTQWVGDQWQGRDRTRAKTTAHEEVQKAWSMILATVWDKHTQEPDLFLSEYGAGYGAVWCDVCIQSENRPPHLNTASFCQWQSCSVTKNHIL